MGSNVNYISSKEQLKDSVKTLLEVSLKPDIMISGIWGRSLHEDIITLIIYKQCSSSCKVIIPKLLFKGDISLSLLRKVCEAEGQVRINNSVTNNLLLIGGYAFVLSFSSRMKGINMLDTVFECAVMIENEEIVNEMKTQFSNVFEKSIIFGM